MATNHQKNFRVLAAKHHKAQKRGRVTYSLPIDLINAVQSVARILDMPASSVVEIILTQAKIEDAKAEG